VTTTITPTTHFGPFGIGGKGSTVIGHVSPGWEPLREAFEANFSAQLELGAQLAVFEGENLVCDLHGFIDSEAKQKILPVFILQKLYVPLCSCSRSGHA